MSFDVKACQLLHFGPHPTILGRTVGSVRVRISETNMGNVANYSLDLKVKADIGRATSEAVRHALLAHAARQLNKLKARHETKRPVAAE